MKVVHHALALALIALTVNALADDYKGEVKTVENGWVTLSNNDGWCGGFAKVVCGTINCELKIESSRCDKARLYLNKNGDTYSTRAGTYTTDLIEARNGKYAGNIYLDGNRYSTRESGRFFFDPSKYEFYVVLTGPGGRYEKLSATYSK